MSIPHTGHLVAEINRLRCEFDGDRWKTPQPALTDLLNQATEPSAKTHASIKEVAERVLWNVGIVNYLIVSWQNDVWKEEIPPDAID